MHAFEVREETFMALPERALWWPRKKILSIADLHLGRAETHAEFGLPRAQQIEEADLLCLDQLVHRFQPSQLYILGDFIHHARALDPDVRSRFLRFSSQWHVRPTVITGNHDRSFTKEQATLWEVERIDEYTQIENFCFSHDVIKAPHSAYNWMGHLHPAWRWSRGADQIKVPCFWLQKDRGVLPAFSSWAAGVGVQCESDDRLLLAEDRTNILAL
jgi:DNA ligase-associated metallophosphoesterase